jgi:hypothetical protein
MDGMNGDLWDESPLDLENVLCFEEDLMVWDEHLLFEEDNVGDQWRDFLLDNVTSANVAAHVPDQPVARIVARTETPRDLEHSAAINYAKKIMADKRLGIVTGCRMIGTWTRAANTLWLCGYKNGTRTSTASGKTAAPFEKDGHDKKCQVTIDAGGVRLHFSICMPRCDYPHHGDAVSIKKLKGNGNLVEFRKVQERHFEEKDNGALESVVNEQLEKKTSQRAQHVRARLVGTKKRGNETGDSGETAIVLSRDKSWKTDKQSNGFTWIQVPDFGVFQVRLSSFIRISSEVKYRYAQDNSNALFVLIPKEGKTMMFLWLGQRTEEYLLESCGENVYRFTRASSRGNVTYTYNFNDLCEYRVYASDNRERIIPFQKF